LLAQQQSSVADRRLKKAAFLVSSRRYATGGRLGDLIPALKGRAKVTRRYASTIRNAYDFAAKPT
jgi:hypothetical protein